MPEEKKITDVKDYLTKRTPDSDLWDKVQQLSQKDDGKIEAINIIFQQQYHLPEDNIELIKKLANESQPKNVRLHIAKNLEKYDNIPFGMYADLFEILSNDPDDEIKKSLENTSLYRLTEDTLARLRKIQPKKLIIFSEQLSKKQEELQRIMNPFLKFQNSTMAKQISALQKQLSSINIPKIKIPASEFTVSDILTKESKQKDSSSDVILSNAAEKNPEIKQAVELRSKMEGLDKYFSEIDKKFTELKEENTKHHSESKKSSNLGLSIALGALCLSVGLAIGIGLLTQGATTHTQLDIFTLSTNATELNDAQMTFYQKMRDDATNHIILGSIIMVVAYVLGMFVMTRKIKVK